METMIRDFLRSLHVLAEDIAVEPEAEKFSANLSAGLMSRGQNFGQAIPMLPTFLNLGGQLPTGEPVLVIDAGGTFFRACVVKFDANAQVTVRHFSKHPMPGSLGRVTKEEFYRTFAQALLPLLPYSRKLGFCFSFACQNLPNHDALVLQLNKEMQAEGVIGTLVGESLREALRAEGDSGQLDVVVLNDTVAGLLAGYLRSRDAHYSNYLGMVLGTGLNVAYAEPIKCIKKLAEPDVQAYCQQFAQAPSRMIINTECGSYPLKQLSPVDRRIDDKSVNPGNALLEKRISGRYLGAHAYETIQIACEEGNIFSPAFCQAFARLPGISSEELDGFLALQAPNPLRNLPANDSDLQALTAIAENVFARAAKYVAILLAGFHMKLKAGQDPSQPLAVNMEGSTYYKARFYQEQIQVNRKLYLEDQMGYYAEFLHTDDANLLGSAMAAYMNL